MRDHEELGPKKIATFPLFASSQGTGGEQGSVPPTGVSVLLLLLPRGIDVV